MSLSCPILNGQTGSELRFVARLRAGAHTLV